ncbi:MAG: hypothetical protein EHM42_14470 [Planctomycetaceae bacterium]|nr:MAG: hypothetical protein EHM42_14470 [Planctomycetaceae bacterium]
MLHFSCDSCGQPLDDQRFVVQLEVYPAYDPAQIGPADLDVDHLQEVAEALREMELAGDDLESPQSKTFRYDLCPRCHAQYVKDPLRRDALRRLNFSEN